MGDTSPLKKAKNKAQKYFNEYIRLRDCLATTGCPFAAVCCTCGKETPTFKGNLQAGHFIKDSKNGNLTSFDEHNVNSQCKHCNRYLNGNDRLYSAFIIETYGLEEFNRLNASKAISKKWTIDELEEIAKTYKQKIKDIYRLPLDPLQRPHKG